MAKMRKSLCGKKENKKIELLASFLFTSFFSLLLLILFPQKKSFATPLPVTTFPPYLTNSVFLRLTGCFTEWLKQNLRFLFVDDVASTADDLCPAGQYQGTLGSFSGPGRVSCGWKTLNMLNALLMDLLDRQKKIQGLTPPADDDPVMCCCDPTKDSENCTRTPPSGVCPSGAGFTGMGKCMALKPEATNYFVVNYYDATNSVTRGYQAWSVTWVAAPGSSTAYWSGLLDQCLPIPLLGNLCLNLSLNDVCDATACGPILNYNATSHPGNCFYTRTHAPVAGGSACDSVGSGAGLVYMSQKRDNWILRYNPQGGISIDFSVQESPGTSILCGYTGSYNTKDFTGNEGFISIELFLNPISIDIDAATPSAGDRITFTAPSGIPPHAENVAPGRTDCNDSQAGHQGDCYVRAYLRARGALKLKIGATLYLEHRTGSWPHLQDVGIAVREINFSEAPWISLALDWTWSEQSQGCTPNITSSTTKLCARKDTTVKAMKTIEFIDVVLRGLFRYAYIPSGLQQYFGPVVFDISGLTQRKTSHFFPTWVRPITQDDLLIDIALGGAPFLGTQVLRSKSCFARNGVGPGSNTNELYLIGAAMIDLDLFRKGTDWKNTNQWYDHRITSCGYVPPPYGNHPAPYFGQAPSVVSHFPHAGTPDAGSVSCNGDATFVGLSFLDNIFTYLVSDIATSGLMCLAISQKGEGFASGLPLPIWTVGQMKLMIPELYNFLESEFGSNVTDMPMIFVFKPKPYAASPGFPQTPTASFRRDWPLGADIVDPLPITADVLLTLPNNDFEIWVDVDNELEQWGMGPGEVGGGYCVGGTSPAPPPGNWCLPSVSGFPTGGTSPARVTIDVGPAGNAFINNFPDCVSFIDCDTTVGNPSDRVRERRFIAQFNVGVTLALDLNFLGCGRRSYKVFGNLASYGFPTTWYNPFDPLLAGNCTNVAHLRRVDLTLGVISRVGSVDVTNDSGSVRVYYPFSNSTFAGYIADFIAVILSGALAFDAQLGYTLSAILDPNDDLWSATPANNNVVRIGRHTSGGTMDRLVASYISRDDASGPQSHPNVDYQRRFLTIAIDLQGFIHPNFFYGVISQLLSGSINLFGSAPRFVADGNGEVNLESLNPLVEAWQKISNGGEYFISFRDIQEFVKKVEKSGLVVPMKKNENGGIDDFPPETVVEYVQASQPQTIIKLSCVDDYTKPDSCWFGWRWKGKMWQPWIQSNTIEIRGLPDGEYEIEVRALDERAIPDITPVTVKFVVDDTPPSIFFPKKAFFKRGDVLRVELWDYITKPEEIEVSYKIDNSEWTPWQKVDFNDRGLGIKLIRLPDEVGTHKVIVRARDKKGNIETREFYFDIGVPVKGIFSCSR
jgi:hypothetical protein